MPSDLNAFESVYVTSRLVSYSGSNGQIVAYVDEGSGEDWNERVVLLAPRYGETKKNNLQLGYTLAANGFKVLRFDQTNHVGDSDGSIDRFTLHGVVEDLVASSEFIDRQFEPEEIILLTQSLSSRCGFRACRSDPRISRFVSIVGMVDMDSTLKAIYNRDIFGEFASGAQWETIDILGFEIDAANFYHSMVDHKLIDLQGTVEDASVLTIPSLHLFAERDLWVKLEDVERVVGVCSGASLVKIPEVGHEINEKSTAVSFTTEQIIRYCRQSLKDPIATIWLPDKKALIAQNKLERERLREIVKFDEKESEFWSAYLGKFGIIEKAHYYVDYFQDVVQLLGQLEERDIILDAGCGSGFFGTSILHSIRLRSKRGLEAVYPLHYCALDLTPDGLSTSYARHVEELVSAHRDIFHEDHGVAYSYRKVDFDSINGEVESRVPIANQSINKLCCSLVISYLKQPQHLVSEIYRMLAPGGVAVISSMKPGCDLTVLYHDSVAKNYSEENDRDAKELLSAAGRIKHKQDSGIYQFFSEAELQRLAFEAGFSDIRSLRSFGDQANVIRVVK